MWTSRLEVVQTLSLISFSCLRKRPKSGQNLPIWNIASFSHFLDVFSAQDERINFSSFACCQASWDTSLEYPQRVLSRKKYFHFIKGLGNFLGPNRKPKWPKNIFLAPEFYYLHINTWNISQSRIQKEKFHFSLHLTPEIMPYLFSFLPPQTSPVRFNMIFWWTRPQKRTHNFCIWHIYLDTND